MVHFLWTAFMWLWWFIAPVVILLIVAFVFRVISLVQVTRWAATRYGPQQIPPTPPATAPRSPDGAYWWDGTAWRPVAPAAPAPWPDPYGRGS